MTEAWTVGRVVRWAADDFRAKNIESPRLEAELLLAHALGTERLRIIVDAARELEPSELARYRDLIQRRRKGEPVAYILGQKEFFGRMFHIDKRVLVPRPDTEILVETALRRTSSFPMPGRFLDLCTGSGCVAISIARERPACKMVGVDLSPDAIAVARENSIRLGAVHQITWLVGDLFRPLESAPGRKLDLITANPPYITEGDFPGLSVDIRDFEPRMALTGGAEGLDVTKRIVAEAPRYLRPGGVLALEMGTGQTERVKQLFAEVGLTEIVVDKDYGGHERVVSGVLG